MTKNKNSNISDKVISLGKILIEFAKQCNYLYSENSGNYNYALLIVASQFILGDKNSSILCLTNVEYLVSMNAANTNVGKHKYRISYWQSYKDEDQSYHYFKDNEMDFNKEVSKWTKYIQNFSKMMKKKSIFEREQKIKEDF